MTITAPIAACQAGRLGHRRERVQAGPDPVLVLQEVVRDLEHAERGDAGGEPRQSHQRQADDGRADTADDGGEGQ